MGGVSCDTIRDDLQYPAFISKALDLSKTLKITMFLLLLLFLNVAEFEAADNSIKPDHNIVPVTEGTNTTLSCTYTGSAYYLHWYRQTPGSRPEFLLLIDESTEQVTHAQPPHPRLSIKLDKTSKKVDLFISSAAVSDSALYYCALRTDGVRIIFGKGTLLGVQLKEEKQPEFYKVNKPSDNSSVEQEFCLATRFTVQDATNNNWPLENNTAEAVRFEGEGYYSRLMLHDANKCIETDNTCDSRKSESPNTFQPDPKTNFLTLAIFWLRVLFLKTIVFNVLMTLKVWMN